MKYCPDCGCKNIDEAQFCRNCGLKFTYEVKQTFQNVAKVNNTPQTSDNRLNSLISKVFYKTDRYTGELRFAKAKSISIIIFVATFLFGMVSGVEGVSFFVVLLTAIIFGLIFAIPTYVLGFIVGIIIERITNK